jgi:hypothetical protein
MNKQLIYKILLVANISITILIVAFIILFHPAGKTLILVSLMAVTGTLGALSMYREIRNSKKHRS